MNNVFINGGKSWYRSTLDKLSGHSYAELMEAVVNNSVIFDPSDSLIKAYKMKQKDQTYTLTANLKDQKTMKEAASQIAGTLGQSSAQEAIFRRLLKYGKYQNMTVKMIVKNQKLYSCNIFINLKVGKSMTARFGQSYGNFGSQDFLKVPSNALNAKQLPTNK